MIILEIFSCETIKDLRRREGEWINSMLGSGMIVNKNSSGKTKEETMKDRYIKNKEYIKKYHNDNKTHILKLAHDYYLKNKEDIHIRKNQKFICECGGKYTNANKNAHQQTIKHISQT
jgi:hypothetical protein